MHKRTYAVTHSPVFERLVERSRPPICGTGPHRLLHGEAAQDAMVAMFDPFGALSSEPPAAVEPVRAPQRRARPTRNGRSGWVDQDADIEATEPMLAGFQLKIAERRSTRR